MDNDTNAPRVKPFAALLYREPEPLQAALQHLGDVFSPIEWHGSPRPFNQTDYYDAEMGAGLLRLLVSFSQLVAPGWLVPGKQAATAIEDALRTGDARNSGRTVNIDVGYVDLGKVVLASGKGRPTKLYLEAGIWADLTLTYADGAWHPLPWTFPDFRGGTYDAELSALRERYKAQVRKGIGTA